MILNTTSHIYLKFNGTIIPGSFQDKKQNQKAVKFLHPKCNHFDTPIIFHVQII